jgi:MFS family permease
MSSNEVKNNEIKAKTRKEEDHSLLNIQDKSNRVETPSASPNTLDNLFDEIGYTFFHFRMILIVSLIFFVDGGEMIIINLLLSTIQQQWSFSNLNKSLLSSSVFFGFFIGSMFSGLFINKFGRKKPTIVGMGIIYTFSLLTASGYDFYTLFFIRVLVGIGIGIVVPAATSLVTETIPSYNRSLVLNILWILYAPGIIYICWVAMHYIKKQELLWREICILNSMNSLCVFGLSFLLDESPRYLLLKKKSEEAFRIINKISSRQLTDVEKSFIIREHIIIGEIKNDFNYAAFINKKNLFISLILGVLWYLTSVISYGLLYILPKLFDSMDKNNKHESLKHMILTMTILFPCPLFRGFISEVKSIGRKYGMIYGYVGSAVCVILCMLVKENLFIYSGFLKFFINTSIGIVSVYTSEVYPTHLRSLALGFGNGLTRVGGITTPFFCEMLENYMKKGSFYMFFLLSIIGVFATWLLPFDTIGRPLDKVEENSVTDCEVSIDKIKKIKV